MNARPPAVVVDSALFSDGKVLLVRCGDTNQYENQAGWFLPDDVLLDFGHPAAGAKRALCEQPGLCAPGMHLRHLESFEGNNGTWHLAFHYTDEVREPPRLAP